MIKTKAFHPCDNGYDYSFSITALIDDRRNIDDVLLNVITALRHILWHDDISFPLEVTGANGTAVVDAKISGRNPIYCPACGCHARYDDVEYVTIGDALPPTDVASYRCDACELLFFISDDMERARNGRYYKLSVLVQQDG